MAGLEQQGTEQTRRETARKPGALDQILWPLFMACGPTASAMNHGCKTSIKATSLSAHQAAEQEDIIIISNAGEGGG